MLIQSKCHGNIWYDVILSRWNGMVQWTAGQFVIPLHCCGHKRVWVMLGQFFYHGFLDFVGGFPGENPIATMLDTEIMTLSIG